MECVDIQPESGIHLEFIAYNSSHDVLGKVIFLTTKSASTGEGTSTIEFFNCSITLDKEHLYLGDSTKNLDGKFAGGHGEGMKVGKLFLPLHCASGCR